MTVLLECIVVTVVLKYFCELYQILSFRLGVIYACNNL